MTPAFTITDLTRAVVCEQFAGHMHGDPGDPGGGIAFCVLVPPEPLDPYGEGRVLVSKHSRSDAEAWLAEERRAARVTPEMITAAAATDKQVQDAFFRSEDAQRAVQRPRPALNHVVQATAAASLLPSIVQRVRDCGLSAEVGAGPSDEVVVTVPPHLAALLAAARRATAHAATHHGIGHCVACRDIQAQLATALEPFAKTGA